MGLLRLMFMVGVLSGLLAASASAQSVYRVRPGDTLSEIARHDRTTVVRLERLNRLSPTSPLLAGAELRLPAPRVAEVRYLVAPGDTLTGIAARFQTTPGAIAAASGIDASEPILIGTTLRVPAVAQAPPEAPAPAVPEVPYLVLPGDTLTGIAARFQTTPGAIAAASGIDASEPILIGTTLRVPAVAQAPLEAPAPAVPEVPYLVLPGDTLTGIAARFRTTPGAIAAASGIDASEPILIGTTLRVPAVAQAPPEAPAPAVPEVPYLVLPGDTLTGIAARFQTTPGAIAAASGIDASEPILIGTTLRVPDPVEPGTSAGSDYDVRAGDTLDGIALRFGVSLGVLADLNHLDVNAPLLVGTQLALPAGSSASDPSGAAAASVRESLLRWADHYRVNAQLATALAWMESGFNNNLVSSAGAVGVMQITPDTWSYVEQVLLLGATVPDTSDGNVRIGVAYLHHLLDIYDGDPHRALAAYYQGARSLDQDGLLPGTPQYVEDILALEQRF